MAFSEDLGSGTRRCTTDGSAGGSKVEWYTSAKQRKIYEPFSFLLDELNLVWQQDKLVSLIQGIRELKQRQRRRQRERHEFAYLVGKNNSFARPARAFFTFVHFFAVVSQTTT